MEYHLEWSNELQTLERKFLTEIEDLENQFFPTHAPRSIRIIEKKIEFLKDVPRTISNYKRFIV
jgi:hypothetical protein